MIEQRRRLRGFRPHTIGDSMKHAILLAAIPLALGGCSKQRAAEAIVRESLIDPESARFGDFYFNDKTQKGCLTVNSKNSMGGYTGNQQAYVKQQGGTWKEVGIADIDRDMCREVHADAVD